MTFIDNWKEVSSVLCSHPFLIQKTRFLKICLVKDGRPLSDRADPTRLAFKPGARVWGIFQQSFFTMFA